MFTCDQQMGEAYAMLTIENPVIILLYERAIFYLNHNASTTLFDCDSVFGNTLTHYLKLIEKVKKRNCFTLGSLTR